MKMIYKISFAICVALAIFSLVGCDSINGLEGEGESFTVTFASNGGQFHTTDGDTPTYSATVQSGQKVTKPTDPTKNIYTFTNIFFIREKYCFGKNLIHITINKHKVVLKSITLNFNKNRVTVRSNSWYAFFSRSNTI